MVSHTESMDLVAGENLVADENLVVDDLDSMDLVVNGKDLDHLPWKELPYQSLCDLLVEDISECVANVHHTFTQAAAEQQQAVREKYADPKFSRISTLTIPATHPPAL